VGDASKVVAMATSTAWRDGPVTITGASGQVGRALQARLAAMPNEVRPLGHGDDLAAAFHGAATVVHLAGTLQPKKPNTYRAANLDTVATTVAALRGSGVERVVYLSFITADRAARNEYLRYKAEAEQLLDGSGTPVTIFRCDHIYGPPAEPGPTAGAFLAHDGKVRVLGAGRQRLAPLFRGDVIEAIVHAGLDPAAPTGTFELAGPETMTTADFVRALNGDAVHVATTPAPLARLLAHVVPELTPALVDVLLHDAVPHSDSRTTAEAFGITLHRVGEVWPTPAAG
jgi:uncharacterized protein YbjT (DUF2867 family)